MAKEHAKMEAAEAEVGEEPEEAKRASTSKLYVLLSRRCAVATGLAATVNTNVAEFQSYIACGLTWRSGILHWRQGAVCSKGFNSHFDRGTTLE